jgi:hypothetical protein
VIKIIGVLSNFTYNKFPLYDMTSSHMFSVVTMPCHNSRIIEIFIVGEDSK